MITEAGANCSVCSDVIDPDSGHFPHESGCGFETVGFCYCDTVAHPECCTNCPEVEGYVR